MPRPRTLKPRSLRHGAFGEAIASVMHERRLTQDSVAHDSGLDIKQISSFIRGQGNPTYSTVIKLCNGLHVSPGELEVRADRLFNERVSATKSE